MRSRQRRRTDPIVTTFPIFQEHLRFASSKKGEFPLFITHYRVDNSYPNHHHEYAEISLVTGGSGIEIVNGTEHRLQPGSITLLPPYHLHALKVAEREPLYKFSCMFDLNQLLQPEFSEISSWLTRLSDELEPYCDLPAEPFAVMHRILEELHAEFNGDSIGRRGYIRIKLLEAIYLFFRYHPGSSALDPGDGEATEEWNYIKYVNTHYMEEAISLEEVAARFGVSVFAVRHAFRRRLGKNYLEYVHQLRIRRAATLLKATDMTVAEIAYDCGFSSLRSFTRVFKEITGMSASSYRKQQRTEPL